MTRRPIDFGMEVWQGMKPTGGSRIALLEDRQ